MPDIFLTGRGCQTLLGDNITKSWNNLGYFEIGVWQFIQVGLEQIGLEAIKGGGTFRLKEVVVVVLHIDVDDLEG